MTLKGAIKAFLWERGLVISEADKPRNLDKFLERFREHYVSVDLVRIGGDKDGGYLIPNMLESFSHCFSPGVDCTADFERHLSISYKIKSFMADASVSDAPFDDENFSFTKKFLGNRDEGDLVTLNNWMKACLDGSQRELLLQMDIEGGEYDVLTLESADTLQQFSVMVIEFHGLQNLFEKHFSQMFSSIFEKMYSKFSICHVHPNNCCGMASLNGMDVPRVIEVTFIRNDHIERLKNNSVIELPHKLDRKNVVDIDDITMPIRWWKT